MRGFLHASMVQTLGTPVPDRLYCLCHPVVPGCVGLGVDTGVKRTSLIAVSSAHPCWLVPCWSNILDRALKSPHIIIVSSSSSSISSRKSQLAPVMQVEGWMFALMRIRDVCLSFGFVVVVVVVVYLFVFHPDVLQFA